MSCITKTIFLLGVLLFLPLWCSQPRIYFDKTEHHWGTLKQRTTARYVFEFRNIGTAPLLIEKIKAG